MALQEETHTFQNDKQMIRKRALKNGHNWIDVDKDEGKPSKEIKSLENIVRRIQLSMTVFGIYYQPRRDFVSLGGANTRKSTCRPSKLFIYNIFVLLLLWGCLGKAIAAIFYMEELSIKEVTFKLIGICWQLQVTLNASIMVKVSNPFRGNHDRTIRHCFEPVLTKLKCFGIETDNTYIRRKMLIVFLIGWSFVLVNVVSLVVVFVLPHGLIQDSASKMFLSPLPTTLATKIALVILHVFCSVAWIHPVVYFVTMTTILKYAFQQCDRALQEELGKSTIDKNKALFPERLSEIRNLHLDICKTVEILDRDFSYLLANLYVTSIPLACFFVYSLVKTKLDVFHIMLYVFWGIAGECSVTVSSLFAASLHESVHMFLSKLTGTTIGFSVLGFFVVTKEVLLTIGGLFLTYVFLLIQF